MRIGIAGAGPLGLTIGYELSKAGHEVTILEAEEDYGGLVRTARIGGQDLECFYHHIFTNDQEMVKMVEELGLSSALLWREPRDGIYINRKLYPFTSPLDLLRFRELSLFSRIAMGSLVLRARFVRDWQKLEAISAKEWITRKAGRDVYAKVWGPLLQSKFDRDAEEIAATWIWNKFKLRGSTRSKNLSKELLGYMQGSFITVYRKMVAAITGAGGRVLTGAAVNQIRQRPDLTLDLRFNGGELNFDRVVLTMAPPALKAIDLPFPDTYRARLDQIRYKANICLILELKHSLSPYYWLTVAEPEAPFVAVIEHTNLIPAEHYGSHIVYLSRYLDEEDELYRLPEDVVADRFLNYLQQIFPAWNLADVKKIHLFRAPYAQPVVGLGYSRMKPGYETPLKHLYLANMAQIYPEDRGQNYAIRLGKEVARLVGEKEG